MAKSDRVTPIYMDLLKRGGDNHEDGDGGLKQNGLGRRPMPPCDLAEAGEKKMVHCHGVIDPRTGQNYGADDREEANPVEKRTPYIQSERKVVHGPMTEATPPPTNARMRAILNPVRTFWTRVPR